MHSPHRSFLVPGTPPLLGYGAAAPTPPAGGLRSSDLRLLQVRTLGIPAIATPTTRHDLRLHQTAVDRGLPAGMRWGFFLELR